MRDARERSYFSAVTAISTPGVAVQVVKQIARRLLMISTIVYSVFERSMSLGLTQDGYRFA
jgi:hypothetical protein